MFYFENKILKIKRFINISYLSDKIISIRLKKYSLDIIGNNLSLTSYYEEEAFIEGNIERIIFNYDKCI